MALDLRKVRGCSRRTLQDDLYVEHVAIELGLHSPPKQWQSQSQQAAGSELCSHLQMRPGRPWGHRAAEADVPAERSSGHLPRDGGLESHAFGDCCVSGHTGRLSQDIVDVLSAQRLVVASRVEGQLADEEAVLVDHSDVVVGNEEGYALPFVGLADGDVSKAAEIAQGHPTLGVDAVPADPEVDGRRS
jgi:hypothetical protein